MTGATAAQEKFLRALGASDDQISALEDVPAASALIDELKATDPPPKMSGAASTKQIDYLRALGAPEELIPTQKAEASTMIDQLVQQKAQAQNAETTDVPADTTGLDKPHGDDDGDMPF